MHEKMLPLKDRRESTAWSWRKVASQISLEFVAVHAKGSFQPMLEAEEIIVVKPT